MIEYPPIVQQERLTAPARPMAAPAGRGRAYWFDILAGRRIPALVFSVFLVDKLLTLIDSVLGLREGVDAGAHVLPVVTQALALGYFSLLVVLYVVRLPKRAGDARPGLIAAAFFGSFSIVAVGWLPGVATRNSLLLLSDLLVAFGMAYSVWSLAYLRRSFSIMPEARRLVTGGPYAVSRHPLYLGETVAGIGLYLPTLGWLGAAVICLYLLAQFARIQAEEGVLSRQFPNEYAAYRRRVSRYLPRPWLLLR